MKDKVGEIFDANISGIIDKGIFVQLKESKAEGLVLFSNFNESFVIEDSGLKAIGKRSRRVLKMGDVVRAKLLDADLHSRQLEFEIIPENYGDSI